MPPQQLSDDQRDEIAQALGRIQEQRQEEGKFFRKTDPEQFGKDTWENPLQIIWW